RTVLRMFCMTPPWTQLPGNAGREEPGRLIDHGLPLTVDGDHVITVAQPHRFHRTTDARTDDLRIPCTGDVVFDGMNRQARSLHSGQLPSHAACQPVKLRQRWPWVRQQAATAAMSAVHESDDA